MNSSTWKAAASVAAGLLVAALGVGVAAQADPTLGTWKLNVAKSKFSPGPAQQTLTVTFTAAGQGIKGVIDAVAADGTKTHWEYTANLDGKPYPVTGNSDGDMVIVKRIDKNTIETSYTLKGKPMSVNTRVVSADGKTMTITTTGTNAQGQKVNNVLVLEKG